VTVLHSEQIGLLARTIGTDGGRSCTDLASYVHSFAGPFLKETPPGKDIDYFTTWIDYKF
jgi:hypothetical protein